MKKMEIAKGIDLETSMINRHGLITGATGTGKSVTLQVIAENFSRHGIPVFITDVKGDLSGIAKKGQSTKKLKERAKLLGINHLSFSACPAQFWDIWAESGLALRTTVQRMGPVLLGRLLDLSPVQAQTLNQVFKIAADRGWDLVDLRDLGAVCNYVESHGAELEADYGRLARTSLGAIARSVLALEMGGADAVFGEPGLVLTDLMRCDANGHGVVNVMDAQRLIGHSAVYAAFLLWLLTELYEICPEVGDLDRPRFVLCFDEAHLLFADMPPVLKSKIEQIMRLIRSKGVGVFFITQSPSDLPSTVLSQLGNRVQHALRAYTPRDYKALKVAAQTLRANPRFNTEDVIARLGVGQALVSFLDPRGVPAVVEKAQIMPPQSQIGPVSTEYRYGISEKSDLKSTYSEDNVIDRVTAYDIIAEIKEDESNTDYESPKPIKSRYQGILTEKVLKHMSNGITKKLPWLA